MRIRSLLFSWLAVAMFVLTGSSATAQTTINCSSNDGGMHSCKVPHGSQVRLLRQRSQSACIEGQTYGVRGNSVWVNNGCRADFQVYQGNRRPDAEDNRDQADRERQQGDYSQNSQNQNVPYDHRDRGAYDGGPNRDNGQPYTYVGKFDDGKSTCASQPRSGRIYCQSGGQFRDASLIKENGQNRCVRGRNWDVDPNHGLWIADGCSGEFKILK